MTLAFLKSNVSFLGWFVRLLERGDYSHVELVFSDGQSFSCVGNEGIESYGVRKIAATSFSDQWTLVYLPFITPEDEKHMRDYAEGMLGKGYDYLSLFGFLFHAGRMLPHQYICSEWVQLILNYGGLWLQQRDKLLSPSGLYKLVTTEDHAGAI